MAASNIPHPSHDFVTLDYHGAPIRACKLCHATDKSPQGCEPCVPKIQVQTVAVNNPPVRISTNPGSDVQQRSAREIIDSLNAPSLREQLAKAEGEVAALRVLLAAAEAMEKVGGQKS